MKWCPIKLISQLEVRASFAALVRAMSFGYAAQTCILGSYLDCKFPIQDQSYFKQTGLDVSVMVFTVILTFELFERTFQISVEKCILCCLYCLEIKEHVCRQELLNVHDNDYQPQRRVWKFVSML